MSRLLRDDLDELDVYVTRVAAATGIPAAHVEKDYWVTEVLRGAAASSREIGCSVVFKGGTSLSKAHRLIERFSEDVDLIVILPAGGKGAHDRSLKQFVSGAVQTTGIEPDIDSASTTKGVKRTATFHYPTAATSGFLKPGVLMELGTRGGALPQRRLPLNSLLAEHCEAADLPIDFAEAAPVDIQVLDPVRTLADKLVLLHHAATEGDEARKATTARHYYDIDCLLRNESVLTQLAELSTDLLAREVCEHSRSSGLPTADRPPGGFAASPAWDAKSSSIAADAYEQLVLPNLVWPGARRSTFDQCCDHVQSLVDVL